MAQLSTLGHIRDMRILPATRQEWLSFLALPFKTFVVASIFAYPAWHYSERPFDVRYASNHNFTIIDSDKLPFGLDVLLLCYFITFLTLLIIAIIQGMTKNRRAATWSIVFAVLALFVAVHGAFRPIFR